MDLEYQQIGEIPPDPNCLHEISVELSAPIRPDGTFIVAFSVPPEQTLSGNTRLLTFEGTLSGSLSDSQGMGQLDVTQALLFCQRNPSQSATNVCSSGSASPCDELDFSYDVSRVQ